MSEHTPVLVQEVMDLLKPKEGDILLDATLGHGGHAKAFLDAAGKGAKVIGLDADPEAIKVAQKNLSQYGDAITYHEQNFNTLPKAHVHAILFDL